MKAKLIVLTLALTALLSCVTAPSGISPAPVVSWPEAPSESIAVSWWAGSDDASLELRLPDGTTTTATGTTDRGFATVELEGLRPATKYGYRVTGGPWLEFTTMPSNDTSLEFAVIGDLQPFNEEIDRTTSLVMRKVASLAPDFALQIGDVAEVGISGRSWRRAISVLSLLGTETPLLMTAGNHDYYYALPSARYFKTIFPAPYEVQQTVRKNTWYSTTVGPAHFAVLDTEADGADFDRQIEWLVDDLRSARANGTEWLFIAMHRPILASTTSSEDERWAKAILPLTAEFGVAAVFWGHNHVFEHYEYRYGANGFVFNADDEPASAPVQLFTIGTAGARVDSLYPGFFTHRPYNEVWDFFSTATGEPVRFEFVQYPWSEDRVRTEGEGTRFQRRSVYPKAASYYSYPFESHADEVAGRYSDDPTIRYAEDAEFFGYTYGETSIHYLWVEIDDSSVTFTAHYADGEPGEHGAVITSPGGTPMRWTITPREGQAGAR